MASSKEYLQFVLDQLSGVDGVTHRAMMGEFILYYRGKVFGGIYDDRFLVKDLPSAAKLMPQASRELPYDKGSPMLMVDNIDDKSFLSSLVTAMYDELPEKKTKK